jgi:hypothetical protein
METSQRRFLELTKSSVLKVNSYIPFELQMSPCADCRSAAQPMPIDDTGILAAWLAGIALCRTKKRDSFS